MRHRNFSIWALLIFAGTLIAAAVAQAQKEPAPRSITVYKTPT